MIPWALSATGVGYHLSGVRKLRLSGPVLAGMYLGQIKTWNDSRIKALNKGVRLPNLKITPVFRSDGSGDTYAFTNYLSEVNGAGSTGSVCDVGYFPTGVGGSGNSGVTSVLESTNGSIAYVAVSYLIAHKLPAARGSQERCRTVRVPEPGEHRERGADRQAHPPSIERAAHRQPTS